MSKDQYQNQVNRLDRDISDLEKKKALSDKKAVDAEIKVSKVSIPKNATSSTIQSKNRQIAKYNKEAYDARTASANLGKKIAETRRRRNEAYQKLQKEELDEQRRREQSEQRLYKAYEERIAELEATQVPTLSLSTSSLQNDQTTEYYDVFISHAWEDKKDFVDELAEELQNHKYKVWYDTSEMKWGDNLREKIDQGLKISKFAIVILSPSYIKEGKYWTKAELDGLFQLESINGKTILPIWHNLTKKQVMEYSPIIANKKALNTSSMTPREIAEELGKLLKETN